MFCVLLSLLVFCMFVMFSGQYYTFLVLDGSFVLLWDGIILDGGWVFKRYGIADVGAGYFGFWFIVRLLICFA